MAVRSYAFPRLSCLTADPDVSAGAFGDCEWNAFFADELGEAHVVLDVVGDEHAAGNQCLPDQRIGEPAAVIAFVGVIMGEIDRSAELGDRPLETVAVGQPDQGPIRAQSVGYDDADE